VDRFTGVVSGAASSPFDFSTRCGREHFWINGQ